MALTRSVLFLLCALALAAPAAAQEAGGGQPAVQAAAQPGGLPADSTTDHTLALGAEKLSYKATAGTLPLTNDKGETTAKVFYVAYHAEGPNRPLSFVFNGGPGAASAFLHLSAIGPRVVNYGADGSTPVEPVALADNPDSWLPFTDMVFVDPVGTGFSRTVGSGEGKTYYGVDQDAGALTDFIRLYLSRHGKEMADVYLVGESYGGFRAVLLTRRLLEAGMRVKGAMLISPALEFSMLRGDEYALVPMALELPSIAASHLELTQGIDAPFDAVREAEEFARTGYLQHLVRGGPADPAIVERLAALTGLDKEIITRQRARIGRWTFRQEYRRRTERAVSVYDGAISLPAAPSPGRTDFDPILDRAVSVLTPVMENYTRQELGFHAEGPYRLLNRSVSPEWDYGLQRGRQGFAGSLEDLQKARTLNPKLQVFIAHGYTDLATPYSHSEFLVGQLSPIDGARPIETRVYRGGHMMYMRPPSRQKLTEDARAVYAD